MILKTPHDLKIVVFGQSCSGKTTFARKINSHVYHCFDALFHWHLVESFGLSITANLEDIQRICIDDFFVLDGWHLSDKEGRYLPNNSVVYVVYAEYDRIVDQYRVALRCREEVLPMYRKWYKEIDYSLLPGVRYFKNQGEFVETDSNEFARTVDDSLKNHFLESL